MLVCLEKYVSRPLKFDATLSFNRITLMALQQHLNTQEVSLLQQHKSVFDKIHVTRPRQWPWIWPSAPHLHKVVGEKPSLPVEVPLHPAVLLYVPHVLDDVAQPQGQLVLVVSFILVLHDHLCSRRGQGGNPEERKRGRRKNGVRRRGSQTRGKQGRVRRKERQREEGRGTGEIRWGSLGREGGWGVENNNTETLTKHQIDIVLNNVWVIFTVTFH